MSALNNFRPHGSKTCHTGLRPSHTIIPGLGIGYFRCGTRTNLTASFTVTSQPTKALHPYPCNFPFLPYKISWPSPTPRDYPSKLGSHSPQLEIEPSSSLIPIVTAQPTISVILSALDDFRPHGSKTHHTGVRPSHAFIPGSGLGYFRSGTRTSLTANLTVAS